MKLYYSSEFLFQNENNLELFPASSGVLYS